ncbi:ABC transporter permease [Dethiobacter alkaliphilus]|uniref:Binding-protein-dependent transport systems inner membrane component n=1 Tax=Dethiobacter alkaliphilus AHT 1 TaxID=555088 RepID=C0GGX2_DETAL|nr:ABC transporter permease [Dethiobacter alkaliphilus]EEG77274.1 binding-protein-dependent transport systems inner membrane component [Dethiobacter alkaliphilus AHT 1]
MGEVKVATPSKLVSKSDSEFYQVMKHLRRNRMAMLGLAVLLVFIFAAVFAPFLTTYDPIRTDMGNARQSPSAEHILGTDDLGRDMFTRLIYGARVSLQIGLIAVVIGLAAGVPLGALSGYYGGTFDLIVQRLVDIMIAFPGILLAIVVVTILGQGVNNVMIAIGIASIPIYTRLVRGSVLAVKEQRFVAAAKVLGISNYKIILRHIMPNCLGPIVVQSTFQVATAILWAAGLSFIGIGATRPTPEWGLMLSSGRQFIQTSPHLTTYPGLAILFLVLGFNLLGDGLRDALDPKSRSVR